MFGIESVNYIIVIDGPLTMRVDIQKPFKNYSYVNVIMLYYCFYMAVDTVAVFIKRLYYTNNSYVSLLLL
jgi:hypothetical protein